jgi:hypothetical protein
MEIFLCLYGVNESTVKWTVKNGCSLESGFKIFAWRERMKSEEEEKERKRLHDHA